MNSKILKMNKISLFNILIEGKEDSVSWTTASVRRATLGDKKESISFENSELIQQVWNFLQ